MKRQLNKKFCLERDSGDAEHKRVSFKSSNYFTVYLCSYTQFNQVWSLLLYGYFLEALEFRVVELKSQYQMLLLGLRCRKEDVIESNQQNPLRKLLILLLYYSQSLQDFILQSVSFNLSTFFRKVIRIGIRIISIGCFFQFGRIIDHY